MSTMGEVLSLAPKQKKLSAIHATLNLLNQELSDFGYSSYAFLKGFTSLSSGQCALPGGFLNKREEEGYCLNLDLLNPLRRSLATIKDMMDLLEGSLPPSKVRRHFHVDSDHYWIQWLEHANEPGKVLNAAAGMCLKVQMALKHIHHTLLLHQGQVIDKDEVDLMSIQDWGSMTSSPCLKTRRNSPKDLIGVL